MGRCAARRICFILVITYKLGIVILFVYLYEYDYYYADNNSVDEIGFLIELIVMLITRNSELNVN